MLSIEKRLKNLHGSLIRRCYDKGTLKKNPNYNDCVVSEDFLDYEKFKDNIKMLETMKYGRHRKVGN